MNCSLAHISEALRASFATPQHLAEALGCPRNSAWRYWTGRSIPNVVSLARLMRQAPELLAAFIEYAGLDERSLQIAAVKLRHAEAALQSEWTAKHADMERDLAADEARLRVATAQGPADADAASPSGDQQ